MIRLAFAVFCVVLAAAGSAEAHTRSQSASDWRVEGARLSGSFSVDARRATLLYGLEGTAEARLDEALRDHLGHTIAVTQNGIACTPDGAPMPRTAAQGYLRAELAFTCPAEIAVEGATLNIGAFFDLSATHLHIVRVQHNGELTAERVLTGTGHEFDIGGGGDSHAARLTGFLGTGVTHVLSGWDHLAFLAALLLLAGRPGPIILTVTGFTLGHSLTMALVALGVLRPYGLAVEVLIGFSILYAALEAGGSGMDAQDRLRLWFGVALAGAALAALAWQQGQAWPPVLAVLAVSWFVASQAPADPAGTAAQTWRAPVLATVFGLAHGAGFAGALLEYDLGGEGLVMSLLGFNLGVEMGQLAAIAVIVATALAVQRLTAHSVFRYRVPLAAGLFGLGAFWTVSRLMLAG